MAEGNSPFSKDTSKNQPSQKQSPPPSDDPSTDEDQDPFYTSVTEEERRGTIP